MAVRASTDRSSYSATRAFLFLLFAFSASACLHADENIGKLVLEDCRALGFERDLRCGHLLVPENRAEPLGRSVPLNMVVVPALDESTRPDAVLYLVGGPGIGATGSLAFFTRDLEELRQTHDVVLVDQRGTGESNPLHCSLSPQEMLSAILAGRFQASTIRTCLDNLDADPVFYTSSEIVDDLDAVRSALGYEQFNLVGISYGSRLALGYLRRYPMRVRTIALRGVASPAGNQLSDIGTASEHAIERLLNRCSKDPGCASEHPDLEETFQRVLSRLERGPVEIDVEQPDGTSLSVTISQDLFAGAVRFALYSDRSARTIPRLISEADRGRWSSLKSSLAAYLGPGLASSLSFGSYLSIVCAEDVPFFDPENTTRSTEPFFFTTSVIESQTKVCTLWPHRVVSADLKEPVRSHVPSLLMSGSEDPATSAASANDIGSLLENSRHLVTPGLAHFPVWTDCFVTNVARLIRSGSTETIDGSCVEDYQPAGFF